MPPGLALNSVWSRVGFLLRLLFAHDAQFFQNPIVKARPPGGGVLSTVSVLVSPALTVKSVHTVILFTFGLGRIGVSILLGTNSDGPNVVFHPGRTTSHI